MNEQKEFSHHKKNVNIIEFEVNDFNELAKLTSSSKKYRTSILYMKIVISQKQDRSPQSCV